MAYDRLNPIGARGDDLRAALAASCIVNNVRATVAGIAGGKDMPMMNALDVFPWMRIDAAPVDDPLDPNSPNFDPEARAAADEAVFARIGRQ